MKKTSIKIFSYRETIKRILIKFLGHLQKDRTVKSKT